MLILALLLGACDERVETPDPPACRPWLDGAWSDVPGLGGRVSSIARSSQGLVVARHDGSYTTTIHLLADGWSELRGLHPRNTPPRMTSLSDGTPLVLDDVIWRWTGTRWDTVFPFVTYSFVLPDDDGGLYFTIAPRSEQFPADVMHWDGDEITSLGKRANVSGLAAFDGHLYTVETNAAGTSVWRRDDEWVELPSPIGGYAHLTGSPLGILVITTDAVQRWNGAEWSLLVDGPMTAMVPCADGVITVEPWQVGDAIGSRLVFRDGVEDRPFAESRRPITTLEVTAEAVFVIEQTVEESTLRRFGN